MLGFPGAFTLRSFLWELKNTFYSVALSQNFEFQHFFQKAFTEPSEGQRKFFDFITQALKLGSKSSLDFITLKNR